MKPASKRKRGFFIGVGCPGCGAELELEQDFFVLTCTHCGSCLRMVMPDAPPAYLVKGKLPRNKIRFRIDRFLKKRDLPLTVSGLQVKSMYYPYWKIDAMVVKVRTRMERREIRPAGEYGGSHYVAREKRSIAVDPYTATVAAGTKMAGVPTSLGMRSQHVKMCPYSAESIQESFDAMPVVRSPEDVQANVVMNLVTIGKTDISAVGNNRTELFHPEHSLVYFPYYVVESYDTSGYCRYLVDGVSGRILHSQHPLLAAQEPKRGFSEGDLPSLASVAAAWDGSVIDDPLQKDSGEGTGTHERKPVEFGVLEVEFHRCSTCGQDLPGRPSRMYICRNCHELTMLERPRLPLSGVWQVVTDERHGHSLFPFWSFRVSATQAPLVKRMFGGVFSSHRLIIPAFAMPKFEALYRLAKRLSAASAKLNLAPAEQIDDCFVPVDVGMNGGLAAAALVIYREMLRRDPEASPEEAEFLPEEASLVFVPFRRQNYFFVDSVLEAVTFEKSLVS